LKSTPKPSNLHDPSSFPDNENRKQIFYFSNLKIFNIILSTQVIVLNFSLHKISINKQPIKILSRCFKKLIKIIILTFFGFPHCLLYYIKFIDIFYTKNMKKVVVISIINNDHCE